MEDTAVTVPAETIDGFAQLPGPLSSSSLPDAIHEILEGAIVEGVLEPGARLRADDLAAHYGISRIPVREALRSLEADGWVEIRPRYGVYVRQRSDEELADLFEVRALLEGYVARRAAERRTEADLEQMRELVKRSKEAAQAADNAAISQSSADFYSLLRRTARNSVLEATCARFAKRARFYFATVEDQLGQDWVGVHEQILRAIKARDAEKAESIARKHIEDTGFAVHELIAAQTA